MQDQLKDQLQGQAILNADYRRKKLLMYFIRTLIAIVLYWFFWDVSWVPYTLWFYVPINLIGLAMLVLLPRFLERKMKKAQAKMDDAQAIDIEAEEIQE